MTLEDCVVETFRLSAKQAERLTALSQRYDLSKSAIIRSALDEHFRILEVLEAEVRHAVISDFVKQNTGKRPVSQS